MFFAQFFSLHVLQWRKILNVFGWKMLCHGYKSVVNYPDTNEETIPNIQFVMFLFFVLYYMMPFGNL